MVASKTRASLNILTFTTLYPNAAQPHHGIFVENRLRHLVAGGGVSSQVVAPVPWFPLRHGAFGSYAQLAAVPASEQRHGLSVLHPRYPVIPKLGMSVAPLLMYAALKPQISRLLRDGGDFDLIDAHYFYPDGVAAVMLGRRFGKPVCITARGTDINLIPRYRIAGAQIRWAASQAQGLVTVCQALKDGLIDLGVEADRVRVLRNGVDLRRFSPGDGADLRAELALQGTVLLSVGHLIPRKAHDLVIRALADLPEASLVVVGSGPLEKSLRKLATRLGIASRVYFRGAVPPEAMPAYYRAADVLVLASEREGWANVLLEAMACGTPVVASNIWGTPEVVAAPEAGLLLPSRSPEAIAATVAKLLAAPPARAATRRYAERFSWEETTAGQIELFRAILGKSAAPSLVS